MKNTTFSETNDRPTPGDFDKDGKTDIAFRRPSNGDIPVGAAIP